MASAPSTAADLPGPVGANSSFPILTTGQFQPQLQRSHETQTNTHVGYEDLTYLACADKSFLVVRQFASLHARIILKLQNSLQSLELQLEETEDASHPAGSDPGVYENRSFLRDSNPDRIKILEKIQVALISYDNFINGYHKLSDRPAVTSSDMCGIKAFLEDYPNAIYDKETSFLGHKRDLITVRPVMTNSFRFKIKYIVNCKKFLFKIRGLLCGGSGTDPEAKCAELRWVYDNKIQEKVTALVSMLGLALLIIPLWILGVSMASSSTMNKLILITVLVVVFYLLVAMATTAKLFESFASAAGRIRGGAHGVPSSHFQHNKMMMLFKLCTS